MATNREKIAKLYKKYDLTPDEVFKHQHYTIITRAGIDKIQGIEQIKIHYDVIKCKPEFAVVKANADKEGASIQTFGSALVADTKIEKTLVKKQNKDNPLDRYDFTLLDDIKITRTGNCNTWYVMEMAEKRAMSRAVLKLTGFYELGVFGEDESEDFKRK